MSGFSQPMPSSISDDVREAGASIGIDVDKLRKKYLTTKLTANLAAGGSEDQLKVKQQLEDAARMRALEANADVDSTVTSDQADEKKVRLSMRSSLLFNPPCSPPP